MIFATRFGLLVAFAILSAKSFSDKVFTIPTGTKIPYRAVRAEWLFEGHEPKRVQQSIGYGITKLIDAEFVTERFNDSITVSTANASFNYLPAFVDMAPGISFGIRDIANRTEFGRSPYIAITYKSGLEGQLNSDFPAEMTLGFGTGGFRGLFVGVMVPFSREVRLIGEHDTHRVSLGFDLRPFKELSVKTVLQDGSGVFSATFQAKF